MQHHTLQAVRFGVPAVALLLLAGLAQRGDAFGLLAQVQSADAYPEPYAGLIAEQPGAFLLGSAFADLERLPDLSRALWLAYRAFNPADRYTPFAVTLHDPVLALDLFQCAESPAERAFAVGYIGNLAGEFTLEQIVVPRRLLAANSPLIDADTARWLVRLAAEWQTPSSVRQDTMATIRTLDPESWLFFYDVVTSAPWNDPISPEAFQTNIALLLLWLEAQVTAAAPGGGIESAMAWLSRLFDTDGLLAPDPFLADLADGWVRIADIAQSLMERGPAAGWLLQGTWSPDSPNARLAASSYGATERVRRRDGGRILDDDADDVTPVRVPWLVRDAWFETIDGARIDRINPQHAEWLRGPIQLRATLQVFVVQPVDTDVTIEVWEDRTDDDRLLSRETQGLQTYDTDTELTLRLEFALDPRGDFAPGGFWDEVTEGLYLQVWGRHPGGDAMAETLWFTTRAPRFSLRGGSTYEAWPYSLRTTTRLESPSACDTDGDAREGSANQPVPTLASAADLQGIGYRFPYRTLARSPHLVTFHAADGTVLEATLYPALGANRAAIAVADWRNSRTAWDALGRELQATGITVLAVNLRGQGFSGSEDDYRALRRRDSAVLAQHPGDVLAAFEYLTGVCGIEEAQIALIAEGVGGWLATMPELSRRFGEVVWLSPTSADAWPEGLTQPAAWRGNAWLVGNAEDAPMMRAFASQVPAVTATRLEMVEVPGRAGQGARLLQQQRPLLAAIAAHLDEVLVGWGFARVAPAGE